MKPTHFFKFLLTTALVSCSFLAKAQNYAALYEDNTYKVLDKATLEAMTVANPNQGTLPLVAFKINNNVDVSTTARATVNGAGTRRASSQASIKPGLKSAPANTFEILCNCKEGYYIIGTVNGKNTDCKTNCGSILAAEKADLVSFFKGEGIDISDANDGKTTKEKAKNKTAKGK